MNFVRVFLPCYTVAQFDVQFVDGPPVVIDDNDMPIGMEQLMEQMGPPIEVMGPPPARGGGIQRLPPGMSPEGAMMMMAQQMEGQMAQQGGMPFPGEPGEIEIEFDEPAGAGPPDERDVADMMEGLQKALPMLNIVEPEEDQDDLFTSEVMDRMGLNIPQDMKNHACKPFFKKFNCQVPQKILCLSYYVDDVSQPCREKIEHSVPHVCNTEVLGHCAREAKDGKMFACLEDRKLHLHPTCRRAVDAVQKHIERTQKGKPIKVRHADGSTRAVSTRGTGLTTVSSQKTGNNFRDGPMYPESSGVSRVDKNALPERDLGPSGVRVVSGSARMSDKRSRSEVVQEARSKGLDVLHVAPVQGIVSWHVYDHAEGKTFKTFAEAEAWFNKWDASGFNKYAARLYDSSLKIRKQSMGKDSAEISATEWAMLDKWAQDHQHDRAQDSATKSTRDSVDAARRMLGFTQAKKGTKSGDGMEIMSRQTNVAAPKKPVAEEKKVEGTAGTGLSVVTDASKSPRVDVPVEDTEKTEKKETDAQPKSEADSLPVEGVHTTGGFSVEEPAADAAVDEAPEMPPTPKTDDTGVDVVKSTIEEPVLEENQNDADPLDSSLGTDVNIDGEVLAMTPAPAPVPRPSGQEFMPKQAPENSNFFAVLTIIVIFVLMAYLSRADHSDTFFHESTRVAKFMSDKVVTKVREGFRKKNTFSRLAYQQRSYG